jgi:hypothetical protein
MSRNQLILLVSSCAVIVGLACTWASRRPLQTVSGELSDLVYAAFADRDLETRLRGRQAFDNYRSALLQHVINGHFKVAEAAQALYDYAEERLPEYLERMTEAYGADAVLSAIERDLTMDVHTFAEMGRGTIARPGTSSATQ